MPSVLGNCFNRLFPLRDRERNVGESQKHFGAFTRLHLLFAPTGYDSEAGSP